MRGQRGAILEHLQKNSSITSMQAFELFGATRLSAIIFDLKKMGHRIDTIMCEGKTRFGDTCQYAKYIYKGVEADE